MNFTDFTYILEMPTNITNEVWYEFAIRCYNLGLTMAWFLILWFVFDTLFTTLSKLYKRGHE